MPDLEARNERSIKRWATVNLVLDLAMYVAGFAVSIWGLLTRDPFTFSVGAWITILVFLADIDRKLRGLRKAAHPPAPMFHIRAPEMTADEAAQLRAELQRHLKRERS